ncbi:MAG: hypothetical protein H0U69_12940, partial [Trueperaceae bacterium]|nr:hypothetical protein [Trueperaceae bacterium]
MIVHEPYGIDDPYKRAATERFPRDPQPGDDVAIGFTAAGASEAWLVLREGTSPAGPSRRVAASALGDGLWRVDLGVLGSGAYAYTLHARSDRGEEASASSPFAFEIGSWHEIDAVDGVTLDDTHVLVALRAGSMAARLHLSFPAYGTCKAELSIGAASTTNAARGLACTLSADAHLAIVTAPGTEVVIDTRSLDMTVRRPGRDGGAYRGTLRSRWLATAAGEIDTIETSFTVGPSEWLYGLGERFLDANRRGRVWDVRVYEEYKEQGARTYLPVPFLVSNESYGLWLAVDEPSHFDLTSERCSVVTRRLPSAAVSLPLHVIVGERPYDVTRAFVALTGEIAVPPPWAFEPWMSANTWNDQATAIEAVRRTVAEDVPAGVIVIEAWSDESTFYIFNDAEYSPRPGDEALRADDFRFGGRWPDPKAFVDECHAVGVRVLLWQIPVHKLLDAPHAQHDLDEQVMIDRGYCILNDDGTPYRNAGWWFTDSLVLDVTNPAARAWWFAKRRYLFDDLHIDGMKTDGGEHLWGRHLRAFDGSRGSTLVNTYALRYAEAYHHFVQEATQGDGIIFSRAGYTGAQRFPAHWAGDEDSTWNAYRASVRAGLSAGVSGISMWSW